MEFADRQRFTCQYRQGLGDAFGEADREQEDDE